MIKTTYMLFALINLLGLSAFAQLPSVEVQNFKADYQNPEGSASADVFRYEELSFGEKPVFDIYQQAGVFVLKGESDEFSFDSLPAMVNEWQKLSVEKIDLAADAKSFSLKSQRIEYVSNEGKDGYISGLDITCDAGAEESLLDSFLDMCVNHKMTFYVPFIGGVSINNINIWTNNNSLQFSIKNKVWIKGYGQIFYDGENNLVRIKVNKAKTGIFNITSKFFDEVEAMENDFIQVERPWIEIKIPASAGLN